MSDPRDILTLAEARNALNATSGDTSQDAEIAGYVTAVSRQIDELCGPVVNKTLTSESYDGVPGAIFLRTRPVYAVSAIVEYAGTTATTLTAETPGVAGTYLLEAEPGIVRRRNSLRDWWFFPGRRNIVVTYTAGRYSTTSGVDERFKKAAVLSLTNLWRRDQGAGSETFGAVGAAVIPGFGLPNAVLDLLFDDIKHPELGA